MTKTNISVSFEDQWLVIKKNAKGVERIRTPNGPLDLFIRPNKDKKNPDERYTGVAVRTTGIMKVSTGCKDDQILSSVLFLNRDMQEVTYYAHRHSVVGGGDTSSNRQLRLFFSQEGFVIGFCAKVPRDIIDQLMQVAKAAA